MKKIITGSLITAIVSNNIVYANELENEFEGINENIVISTTTDLEQEKENEKEDAVENKENVTNTEEVVSEPILEEEKQEENANKDTTQETTTTQVNVSSFKELQDALATNDTNKVINVTNEIIFTANLEISVKNKNIIINGNGHKFLLNKNQINLRAEGTNLNNIIFEDYTSQAISVYNTKNVTLDQIELIGTVGQSSCGIDIGASDNSTSSVTLSNITSKNHKSCGIRVKNGSKVELGGGNTHINDKQDLYVIDEENKKNDIKDEKQQYVDRKTSDNKNIYYTCHNTIDISNFEQLKEAISSKRATINIKNNIELP